MKIEPQKLVELIGWPSKPEEDIPIYQFIYNRLKKSILDGDIPNTFELPPTRALSVQMEVSRSTIIKVYDLLKLEGLLEAVMGSAYRVSIPVKLDEAIVQINKSDYPYVNISQRAQAFHTNVSLINSIEDPGIAFRPGIPPLDLFPISKWKKLSDEYWKFVKASELSYYAGAGVEVLRKTIANYLNLRRNLKCNHQQVFIVSGSLQSLYLIGSLLIDPGDEVLVETPTFPNVHSIFKSLRASVTGLPVDEKGVDVRVLESVAHERTKLLHVTPSCHYPLGMQMSLEQKEALLSIARIKGLYIVENDYENEINFPKRNGKPIFSLDTEDRTFYLGTFNRMLHPSIRVGFAVVPRHLIHVFHAMVMHSHRFVSPNVQVVLQGFIEKNYLHEHLKNVSSESVLRYQYFMDYLRSHLSHQLTPIATSTPSLHITALLRPGISDTDVVSALSAKGIIAHALSKCYVTKPAQHGLIFGYASVKQRYMAPLLQKMASVLNKF